MHLIEAKNTSKRAKKKSCEILCEFSPLKLHRMRCGCMAIWLFPVAFHVVNHVKLKRFFLLQLNGCFFSVSVFGPWWMLFRVQSKNLANYTRLDFGFFSSCEKIFWLKIWKRIFFHFDELKSCTFDITSLIWCSKRSSNVYIEVFDRKF